MATGNIESPEDWQSRKTLKDCNSYMLANEIQCDIHFKVGEKEEKLVHAHKYVLASRSPVFYTMLYGLMAIHKEHEVISIPDVEPDIFEIFLQYLYTDDVTINGSNACALMYIATKYNVRLLVEKCERFLKSAITTQSVCVIIETATRYDATTLLIECHDFILKNSVTMIQSGLMDSLDPANFRSVIASDELAAEEIDIFSAVKSWARHQCKARTLPDTVKNERKVIDDIIKLVRFPLLNIHQFTGIAESGILTKDEQIDVFKTYAKGSSTSAKFPFKPRRYVEISTEEWRLVGFDNNFVRKKQRNHSHDRSKKFKHN